MRRKADFSKSEIIGFTISEREGGKLVGDEPQD